MRIVWEILWCVFVVVLVLMLATYAASTSPICLSKSEARQLWPRKHLYWYSADHCWSNRRGGPPRGIKIDRLPESVHAEAKKEDRSEFDKPKPVPTIIFPNTKLIFPWMDSSLLSKQASTLQHRLLDIDELTSKQPDPPECCWPELNADGSLK